MCGGGVGSGASCVIRGGCVSGDGDYIGGGDGVSGGGVRICVNGGVSCGVM